MALPVPEDNRVYKEKDYWNQRFTKEESYDWLGKFDDIQLILETLLKKTDRILLIGCGNSTLSADLYDHGYENLVNVDYSDVVIQHMREKHQAARPRMEWHVMNMLDLKFPDGSFDVVLDKAAMDALCVDEEDVWDPKESVRREVHQTCLGVRRVLKPDGLYIQISFAQPHFRRKYLDRPEQYGWSFETKTFDSGFGYFCYIMLKDPAFVFDPSIAAPTLTAAQLEAIRLANAPSESASISIITSDSANDCALEDDGLNIGLDPSDVADV